MNRLTAKICACGVAFMGGPTAVYCPICRAERIRQRDHERYQRKLAGNIRHIGSTDLCTICGNPYEVKSGNQKYCESCSAAETKKRAHELWFAEYYGDPVKRKKYIDCSRHWAASHKDRITEILRQSYERHLDDIKNKRRKMYGYKLRPLGRTEICPKCGNEFIVNERNQKYCDACR